jgi:hypothetical protein
MLSHFVRHRVGGGRGASGRGAKQRRQGHRWERHWAEEAGELTGGGAV